MSSYHESTNQPFKFAAPNYPAYKKYQDSIN